MEVLRQEILDKIKTDPMLYGKVAAELKLSPTSMPRLIYDNSPKFTQSGVLKIIREHLKVKKDSDLLQELELV